RLGRNRRVIADAELPAELRAEIVVAVHPGVLAVFGLRRPVEAGAEEDPLLALPRGSEHQDRLRGEVRQGGGNATVHRHDGGLHRYAVVAEFLTPVLSGEFQRAPGGKLRTDAKANAVRKVKLIRLAAR